MVTVGEIFDRFHERHIPLFHDEVQHISAGATTEAVVKLILGIDMKGRGFFLMKRTQPSVSVTVSSERHYLSNNIGDINSLFYQSGHI